MADISFACPSCQQFLEAPPEMAGEVIACPSCSKDIRVPKPVQQQSQGVKVQPTAMPKVPSATFSQKAVPLQTEIKTNVKQGALIGGFVCFVLGVIFMFFSLLSFFLYVPFFFAAFVLSIVAMAQHRVIGGVGLLILTLIVPGVLGLVLFSTRTAKVAESLSKQMQSPTQHVTAAPSSPDAEVPSDKTVSEQVTKAPEPPKYQALDEKNGFRSFVLGTPFSQLDASSLEKVYSVKADEKCFTVKGVDTKLGNAEISHVTLVFSQDLLKEIKIGASGKQNMLGLREALIAAYGQPVSGSSLYGSESLKWDGEHTKLTLLQGGLNDESSIAWFENKDVEKKIDDIIKAKAKEGAKEGAKQL